MVFRQPVYRAAELLFEYEDMYQRIQREYFAELYAQGRGASVDVAGVVRGLRVYMPVRDRARLLAVFYDRAGGLHLVWSDEYVPLPGVDEAYREIRRLRYGRTADVESIHIDGSRVRFVTTYGPPNLYETAMHSDGEAPLRQPLTIYVWTWNHMMHTQPSLDVLVKGGYREETGFVVRYGTREDAERYAREVSSGG